jgi:hypothetical protein
LARSEALTTPAFLRRWFGVAGETKGDSHGSEFCVAACESREYLEETNGQKDGASKSQYKAACDDYPALMNIAHQMWARELFKGLP